MKAVARILLNKGKEHSLKRRHPWVFSGAIKKIQAEKEVEEGEVVEVFSAGGEFLGVGHYQPGGSIAVRIFSFEPIEPDYAFWKSKIQAAMAFRRTLGFGQQAPMQRAAQPDEIAPSYVFFASGELSSYYSGEVLAPIGGETLPG